MYDPRLRPGFGGKESFRLFSCILYFLRFPTLHMLIVRDNYFIIQIVLEVKTKHCYFRQLNKDLTKCTTLLALNLCRFGAFCLISIVPF